jgi:MFS family permease
MRRFGLRRLAPLNDPMSTPFDGHAVSRRYAWYVVLLLTAAQIASFMHRYLPSILLQPIKHAFELSDFQIGLLLGPVFAIVYCTMALPFGWMADRWSRRLIVAFGITLWCCMTGAGAFVASFVPLMILRLGVGLGQASLSPCAVSLISDYFPKTQRHRAVGVYMTGTGIGAGVAYILISPLAQWLMTQPPFSVPIFGEIPAWQMTFAIMGPPGILLALLMLTVKEPKRTEVVKVDEHGQPITASMRDAMRYIARRWRAFGTVFVATICLSTLSTLNHWNVALFQRTWDWSVRDVGIAIGLMFFTAVPLGTFVAIKLTNRGVKAGRPDATMRTMILSLMLAIPTFAAYPLMPSAPLAIAMLFLAFIGQAAFSASSPAALTQLAPGQIRAQSLAIFYMVNGLVALTIGPPPVGWMTDTMGGPEMLRYAMTIEALGVGIPSLIIVVLGLKHYARATLS